MTERKPVVDLSEELAHVSRVFRLHLPLEPVHLVHVLAVRKKNKKPPGQSDDLNTNLS